MRPTLARRSSVATLVGCLLLAAPIAAEFVNVRIDTVPVDRLVANLERMVAENPKDAELLVNLARVHAMAYALKTDRVDPRPGSEQRGVDGPRPTHEQPEVKRPPNPEAEKVARAHLEKAIARYKQAVAVDPNNLTARLGLGWALAQAGQKAEAIARLREVATRAWPADDKGSGGMTIMHGWRTLTEEAARYLIPLLDPQKDRDEIETLRRRATDLQHRPRPITPIAIPLEAGLDAIDITDTMARVAFDADGSGLPKRWTWITPDAGWLVYDHDGSGRIDSALQLFGNVTFWLFWENGYRALQALDDDGDGRVAGHELAGLAIWRDGNVNGISERGEVQPLARWGIISLSYTHEVDPAHPDEIAFAPKGVTFRDGTTRPTFDIVLHRW